jgi:hypothetical protein
MKQVTALTRPVRAVWSRSCAVKVGLVRPMVAKASAGLIVNPEPHSYVEKRKEKDD